MRSVSCTTTLPRHRLCLPVDMFPHLQTDTVSFSQAQTVAKEALQLKLDTTSSERDALQAESESLRERLTELVGVQQELAELQVQHETAAARLAELEEQHEVRQQGKYISNRAVITDAGEFACRSVRAQCSWASRVRAYRRLHILLRMYQNL